MKEKKRDWLNLKIADPEKIEFKRKKSPIYLWILVTFFGLIPAGNIVLAILLIICNIIGTIVSNFDRSYCSLGIFSNCFWFIILSKISRNKTNSFINFLNKEI